MIQDQKKHYNPDLEAQQNPPAEKSTLVQIFGLDVNGFFGMTNIITASYIVAGLDLFAFTMFLIAAILPKVKYGAVFSLIDAIFFILAGGCVVLSMFLAEKSLARIVSIVAMAFHAILVVFCFVTFIWCVVDHADSHMGHGKYNTGWCLGWIFALFYMPLSYHSMQICNSFRIKQLGGKSLL